MTSPPGVCILGTGMSVPRRVMRNEELKEFIDTSDEWVFQRTGIRQRYVCGEGETCSTLATGAARQALANAKIDPRELDLVIVGTCTPDMPTPSVSCQVVANVGAIPCGAMDINLACTGFVGGLNVAHALIRNGPYRKILVIGAEHLTSILRWQDRRTSILFGDGAGAAVLGGCDEPGRGCIYQNIHSDGNHAVDLYCPRREADILCPESFNGQLGTVQMNGREVFKFAVSTIEDYLARAMRDCNLTPRDVALVIPHQSNARIIESARERLGFTTEQMFINIDRYGNTSAASVGICLHEATAAGRIKRGDIVIFIGVGAGLTWATSIWKL